MDTTNIFPIIHPKKANEIDETHLEDLHLITCYIANFQKYDINYGTYFLTDQNKDSQWSEEYLKIIKNPIDLRII